MISQLLNPSCSDSVQNLTKCFEICWDGKLIISTWKLDRICAGSTTLSNWQPDATWGTDPEQLFETVGLGELWFLFGLSLQYHSIRRPLFCNLRLWPLKILCHSFSSGPLSSLRDTRGILYWRMDMRDLLPKLWHLLYTVWAFSSTFPIGTFWNEQ